MRRCWTCQSEHELDEACPQNATVRSLRSAGAPGNELADHTVDLFDEAEEIEEKPRAFPARYRSPCAGCIDFMKPGEMIIGTPDGYMHEECALDD